MNRFTIRKKVFLYICTLTTLSLLIITYVLYTIFFQTLTRNEIDYTIESSNKTKQNIEFILKLVDNTGTQLGANKDLLDELSKDATQIKSNYEEHQNRISTMLQNIISVQEYIKGIYVLGTNGSFYTSDWGIKEDELKKKYGDLLRQDIPPSQYYVGEHQISYHSLMNSYVISYIRPVFDLPTGKNLGTIIIDINYDYLKEIFTISSIQNDEKVLVVDSAGENIFTYPYNIDLDSIVRNNPELITQKNAKLFREVFGKDSIIVSSTIEYSDWKIIKVISTDKIYKDTNKLGGIAIYVSIFFILAALCASLFLSTAITKPISELNEKIKLVEKGDLSVNIKVKSNDELGQLSRSFNNMVIRLKNLINELLEEQKKKSDMEFQILQAQINPHFLYNTLDSIKWLAAIQNVNNICDMASSLINLLKYNISRSDSSVTLAEEIESVNNYIKIQKCRYGDIFSVQYEIMEETLSCKVLRFILQPIVENAIFHGFENMDGDGVIIIRSFFENENLIIEVEDNGVGMDGESLANIIVDHNRKDKFSGIGLRNIEERIKLYFGEKYGLSFQSSLNKGTKVTITLPCIYEDKQESKKLLSASGL